MMHFMPTALPRITVTLTPEVASVLRSMSEVSGKSQSAIVGELLESTRPVFERVVSAMHAAASIRDSAQSEIVGGLARAQARLEAQLPAVLGGAGGPSGVTTPVPLTGGSGPQGGSPSGGAAPSSSAPSRAVSVARKGVRRGGL